MIRRVTRRQTVTGLLIIAVGALAGCGSSGSSSSAGGPPSFSPTLAAHVDPTAAVDNLINGPYDYGVNGDLAFDTTGIFGKIAPLPVSGSGSVASAERVAVNVNIGQSADRTVVYDGTAYVSNDGGKTFSRVKGTQKYPAGSAPALGIGLSTSTIKDQGPSGRGEAFEAPLNAADPAVQGFISSVAALNGKFAAGRVKQNVQHSSIAPFVSFSRGTIGLTVDVATGHPLAVSYHVEVKSDLNKMNQAIVATSPGSPGPFPPGVEISTEQITNTINAFGALVQVTPPPA